MSESTPAERAEAEEKFTEARNGDYEVIYRLPASEDYPFGEEVGFIKYDGWLFAVDWDFQGLLKGKFGIVPDNGAPFPSSTVWMITDNSAIDYGLEA